MATTETSRSYRRESRKLDEHRSDLRIEETAADVSSGGGGFRHFSDIRLKEAIVPLGRLDNGIGLYRFRYKGGDRTVYVGVMAQEVQTIVPEAVSRGRDGYLRVDYQALRLPFMTWREWIARSGAEPY